MSALIAVDLGCTTVVAVARDGAGRPHLLEFEGEDGPPGVMTASLVVRHDGSARVGGEADRALDDDPHLGVRGPLAHLESGSAVLELQRGPVPVVALVAELLARPLRVYGRGVGTPGGTNLDGAVLAIPSAWPPDGRRARALRAAAALAGLPPVTLVPAAIAAAQLESEADSETVLVCDVGGRATQLSLVDLGAPAGRLLATTELAVGADLFDETLYLDVLRLLEECDDVAARHLEEQHMLTALADAEPDAALWAACQAGLARAVRRCREALGEAPAWELEIGPPVGATFSVERDRLAALLEAEVGLVAAAARAQVEQARAAAPRGSRHAEPTRAVVVGGGAQAPGLREALAAELGLTVAVADDPVTAVARGALVAAGRIARAPAPPVRPRRATPQPAPAPQPMRTVLDDVAAAVIAGDDVIAVVRHDAHQRVVRADARGRVGAAHGIDGSGVNVLVATAAGVIVANDAQAAVLAADLRPLRTLERPLLAAAGATSAWIACAGDEQAPILRLETLALEGRAARTVDDARLGLAITPAAGRSGRRAPARAPRPAPPAAHWRVDGDGMLFAIPARGRGGRPAQLLGGASAAGLGDVVTKGDGPPWVTARTATAGGAVAALTGGAGTPARLAIGDDELATWPAGVRISIGGSPADGGAWIVAARHARWEALRLDGEQLTAVRAGDGAVELARAGDGGLWLVCESGGERRLVCVTVAGELQRLAALSAPLEPIGRSGGELLALVGARGAPRRLVALG